MPRTIDLTPTWRQAAQIIAAALECGTGAGRDAARAELFRMGELLDQLNAERAELDRPPARFDVIAGPSGARAAFGQSFATEADALAYAAAMRGHGFDVDTLPPVEALSVADALLYAAGHYRKPELAALAQPECEQ